MPRLLASMMRFSIWSLMPRPCRPPMRLASRISSTGSAKSTPLSATGRPSSKRTLTRSRLISTSSRQNATPMIGLDDRHAGREVLEVLGLVRGAEHVRVGRVRLLGRHLVAEAGLLHERRHLGAAAELVDELLVEPGLVDPERRVGQQAVAVEPLDVVALVGAAVAPDVDVVLLHGGDEHGAGHRTPERGGVEVGHAGGRDVEGAALQVRRCPRLPSGPGSRSAARSRRRTASPCAGSRRSPTRRAGRGCAV